MTYLGIDGCKAGWFMARMDEEKNTSFVMLQRITELDAYLDSAKCICIDIPIGLHRRHPDERLCDKQARKVLRPKRSASVFPAPSRCALACETYEQANQRNRECTGRGLSRQSFAIMPKIREVDEYLHNKQPRPNLHEMHPEIGFWTLNEQTAMQYNKKESEGYEERMAVLTRYLTTARDIIEQAMQQYKRSEVARDDIVDALVCALIATHYQSLRRFPEQPEIDEVGLPMEIVY
ncbi:MAG: DUF429 domain-containing protein [Thioalkalispiraceae bacterium]